MSFFVLRQGIKQRMPAVVGFYVGQFQAGRRTTIETKTTKAAAAPPQNAHNSGANLGRAA